MKYMNHVKSGLLAMAFACAGICFTGCEDDVVINTGNSDKLDTVDGVYGYVKSAAGARELTPISVFGDKVATGHLYFELSKAAEQDVTVPSKWTKTFWRLTIRRMEQAIKCIPPIS